MRLRKFQMGLSSKYLYGHDGPDFVATSFFHGREVFRPKNFTTVTNQIHRKKISNPEFVYIVGLYT